MADAFFTLVATPLIEKLRGDAFDFCNNRYNEMYGVEDDIQKLQSHLSLIAAVLKDAERCTEKTAMLIDWLQKLRDASLDVEDVLETYAAEAALRELKRTNPVAWLFSRWNAAARIKEIVERIELICDERKHLSFNPAKYGAEASVGPAAMNYRENRPDRVRSEVIGREEEKEMIVQWLLSPESSTTDERRIPVYAITGMAGLGKTTIAQLVYNDERVFKKKDESCHFKKAAWVHVSADFSVDKILKDIAELLTEMSFDGISRPRILSSIEKVVDGKPLFLVLDDVWVNPKLAWVELQHILKTFPRGIKVLVTSRDHTIDVRLDATNFHRLGMLTEDHCWELFCTEVCYNGEAYLGEEKEAIGKEIIAKCQSLPLAVKLMGGILRGKKIEYWERTMNTDIWKVAASQEDEGLSNIRPVLILSFDDLSPILKECFAYTSIFPKGHMFDKHELVKLWMAEGFIQHSSSTGRDQPEQLGGDYFDKLCNRSFFQSLEIDKKERFKMHDLTHDLARDVSITSQQIEDMEGSIDTTCRHASILCKDVEMSTVHKLLRAQKLRTLLLPFGSSADFSHALNEMFQSLRYMRVLDLSSSNVIELPDSIKYLKLLCYLDLSRNEIRLLPSSICELLNLQVLKLLSCTWLQGLPNDFGNLKDLRHLELDEMFWYKCSKLPPRLGGLTNLHNLHRFHVHLESGSRIEEMRNMNSLEGSLHISNLENAVNSKDAHLMEKKGLRNLVLEWSKGEMSPQDQMKQEEVLEDLQPHHNLQQLRIEKFKGSRLPNWLGMGMLQNLYKLSLNHCVNCKFLSLGTLPHLQDLHIKGMLELEDWSQNTSCPSLSRLTISHCPKLQNLPRYSFQQVYVMKIKRCYALKALPLMPLLRFLTLINNDLLEDWSEELLMSIDINFHLVPWPSYSRLVELVMVNCPSLMTLPHIFAPQKLKIRGCLSLNALPSQQYSQRLQYLEVVNCNGPSLIETVQMSSSLDALTISNISNMPLLPKLPNFPRLRSLHIHNCQQLESLSNEDGLGVLSNFTSLKFLSISDCGSLTILLNNGLPTSIECLVIKNCCNLQSLHGRNNIYLTILTSLKDLYLEDCPKLESLIEDKLPDSLQHLSIRGCPLLKEHYHEGGMYWDRISNVADLELDEIFTCESQTPFCCIPMYCDKD